MKRILLLFFLSHFLLTGHGMINPFYKEVMQRGYEVMPGDSVKFPDGSVCSIEAFNNLQCGQQWMTDDYCIPEGQAVWDDDKCCEGLEPYLKPGVDGQATCQEIKKKSGFGSDGATDEEEEEGAISAFLSSKTVLYFFMGVLIPLGLFVILAISVKKRLPKKDE